MKEKILNATHGGLDIILSYYPQARECVEKKQKHFKIREESTASASLKEFNGIWYVKDFGATDNGGNCFDIAMREENLTFSQVLPLLAQRFNVDWTLKESINKPTIAYRPATKSDAPFSYVARKPTQVELDVFGPFVTEEVLEEYNYYALESYSIIKGTQVMTFSSNENYPIFMHDCGEFKKIYKPLEFNKEYRFFTSGQKPRDYVNGLDVVRQRFQSLQRESGKSGNHDDNKEKSKKLPEVIICSGERDAMNVAGLGYLPVWFNSETANIDQFVIYELLKRAERVYNIPDIDETGLVAARTLALKHLEIYTVTLPMWLKSYRDNRGRPRKDLRDYFDLQRNPNDFTALLSTAAQCKFWTFVKEVNGHRKYNIRHSSLLCYLKTNGFCKYRNESSKRVSVVRVEGYKVKEYEPQDVRDFIRNDLLKRQIDTYVLDAFLMSKKITSSVANELDIADIDFSKSTNDSRTLFFKNTALRVTSDKVETLSCRDIKQFVWEENVSPHDYSPLTPAFEFQINPKTNDLDFAVKHTQSKLFGMMINASRIYWREEFEKRTTGSSQEDISYKETYRFAIDGARLKAQEKLEQTRHLVNKIYALGYQLHCYKVRSKALALWMMENKVSNENESSGGSGKSFFANALAELNLVNIATLEGRNKKLTDNAHVLDRITTNTDIILVDDAHRNFDFDSFYSVITGGVTVNPKGEKSFEIKFSEAPILTITSNFPMPNDDKSTMRRILPVVFSDYYHFDNGDGTYKETRTINDDFGKDIFSSQYTEEEYNADINFCIDCLRFYLTMEKRKMILFAPQEDIKKRLNMAKMSEMFRDWADVYFTPENNNLNCLLKKHNAWQDFLQDTGANENQWKVNRFMIALRAYAQNNNLIVNPPELTGYNAESKRIIRFRGGKSFEYFYLQTEGESLHNERFNDEFC